MKKRQDKAMGREIRNRRIRKDMMQAELASKVGIPKSYMCNIESGKRVPSMTVTLKIAKALGCTVDDLLAG